MRGFGEVCRQVRVARGKSHVKVAEDAGIFQSRVSEIEQDAYSPGLELAEALARGLDAKCRRRSPQVQAFFP